MNARVPGGRAHYLAGHIDEFEALEQLPLIVAKRGPILRAVACAAPARCLGSSRRRLSCRAPGRRSGVG